MFLIAVSLVVLVHSEEEAPELNWVSPANCAWGNIDSSDAPHLPFEISWDDAGDDEESGPEYQIGLADSNSSWQRFPGYHRNKTSLVDGRRFFKGYIPKKDLPDGDLIRSFIRGRWANRHRAGRARAAHFSRGNFRPDPPTIQIGTVNIFLPVVRDSRPPLLRRHRHRVVPIRTDDNGPLVSVAYKIGQNGEWHHGDDVAPGDTSISIPESKFPATNSGEVVPIQFKAFNGIVESPPTEPLRAVGNYPPSLSVHEDRKPIIHDYGRRVEMPFDYYDPDDHPVSVHYRFDDAPDWVEAPPSETPNHFDGAIFGGLNPDVDHTMHILVFDGHDESDPISVNLFDFLRNAGSSVKSVISRVAQTPLELPRDAMARGRFSGRHLARGGLKVIIAALGGESVGVSYNIDGSNRWEGPVSYPLGEHEVFNFGDASSPHLQPGPRRIGCRFHHPNGRVTEDSLDYRINSPPSLQVTNPEPLVFRGLPTSSITLPISVSDVDEDPLSVWYRFEGEDPWSHVPSVGGHMILPPEAFSGHLKDGKGAMEVFGWDGLEKSGEPARIAYVAAGISPKEDVKPEKEEERPAGDDEELPGGEIEEDEAKEVLAPAEIVGIAVGGVAVIALIVGVVLLLRKKKSESSSPGLVETE